MDHTAIALGLIKAYRKHFNCIARNKRTAKNVLSKSWYVDKMKEYGFHPFINSELSSYSYKEALRYFQDNRGCSLTTVYVSKGVKNAAIRFINKKIKQAIAHRDAIKDPMPGILDSHNFYIKQLTESLQVTQDRPVDTKLGKLWRTYVKAVYDGERAYKEQFEVRSAIKVFNKLNTGISIHFGSYRVGAMNRIRSVSIDGDKIRVSRFLDNAEFETAVLAAT